MAGDPHPLGPDLPLGQPDPLGQLVEDLAAGLARDDDAVDLLDPELGVGQLVGELAVVGQEDQAGALLVEPADRVDALGDLREQVDDQGLAGGVVVGRDVTLGLVDGVIDVPLGVDLLAVDGDDLVLRVDLGPQLPDGLAVDRDSALEDQLLAGAARADPGVGENLLEPFEPAVGLAFVAALGGVLTGAVLVRTSPRPLRGAGLAGGALLGARRVRPAWISAWVSSPGMADYCPVWASGGGWP